MNKEELRRLAEIKIQLKDQAPEQVVSETAREAIRHFIFDNKLSVGTTTIKGRILYDLFLDQFEETAKLRGVDYSYFVNELLTQFPSSSWNPVNKTFSLNTETHPILKDQESYAKEKYKEKVYKGLEERRQKKNQKSSKSKKENEVSREDTSKEETKTE